jgi:hypothetical protein
MKKFVFIALVVLLTIPVSLVTAGGGPDCTATGDAYVPPFSVIPFSFTCASDNTVYFGVCDSGTAPNDDLFNIVYMGSQVSYNQFSNNTEYVMVGTAQVTAGTHDATLNSLNQAINEATYSYAVSADPDFVEQQLTNFCGTDFGGTNPPPIAECMGSFPVFTTDTAPSAGTLKLNVLFGNMSREEGTTYKTWSVTAGQRINNDTVTIPTPRWARLWWQPQGSSTWYLLPSQYWMGDGTRASEYGLSCGTGVGPSYHTSFSNAIPASEVPAFNP